MENDKFLIPDFEEFDKPLESIQIQPNQDEDYAQIKAEKKKQRAKKRWINLIIIMLIVVVYIISPLSNVKEVIVSDTKYIGKEEIIKLSKITKDSKFIFVNNFLKPKLNHSFIKDYTIENQYNGMIKLNVVEKRGMGYLIMENSIDLLLEDGTLVKLDEMKDFIISLPKINSDETAFLEMLATSLKGLDSNLISRISEIEKHKTSYEENTVILKMEDGNKVYGSMKDLHLMQNYNNILESINEKNQCIQLDEATNSAFKFKCP